jgi:hypothetical protein
VKVAKRGRVPLLGTPKDMFNKALEWASVFIEAPLLRNIKGRSFLRTFEIKRYNKKYVKMPCKQVSLSIEVPLWNLEEIRLSGLFVRKL